MKKKDFGVIVLVLILMHLTGVGQAADEAVIPPGMELRMVGQTSIVVPEDAKIEEKSGLIIVEGIDKYVARALFEMKKQVKDLEAKQKELSNEVEQLKVELADKNNKQ